MLAAALLLSWTAVPKLLTPDSSLRPPHSVGTNDRLASDTYDANGHQKSAKPKALPPGDRDFEAVRTHGARNGIPRRSGNCYTLAATGITAGDVYDAWNRLVRRVKTDGTVIDLGYDHVGNRVTKTVSTATNATFTAYLVDANSLTGYAQVLEELRDNGAGGLAVFRTYAAGNDLISQTQLLPDGNGGEAWVAHYYLYDGQGSVWGLADESGAVTDYYLYDAFGLHLREEGAGTPNVIRYTGEQWDADLGHYYLRARWYEPSRGRFWTQDSFEGFNADPISLHKYLYANANPVMCTDPTGAFSLTEMMSSAQVIGMMARVAVPIGTTAVTTAARTLVMADEDGLPDGAIFSFSALAATSGGCFGGGLDVIFHFKTGHFYLYGTAEGGFSPLSYLKAFRAAPFSSSVTGGLLWNLKSPDEWSGTGYTATWPASASFLLARAMGRTNPMWGALSQLAKREHNVKWSDFVVQIGVSTSGPAALKFGIRSNSFSAEGCLASAPVDMNSACAKQIQDMGVDLSALASGDIKRILGGLR